MCLHVISLLTVFVLPKLMRGKASDNKRSVSSTATNQAIDDCNNGSKNGQQQLQNESNFSSCSSSSSNSMNDISKDTQRSKTDTNYLLKNLISKEVNKIREESDNLSKYANNLLKEKIDMANIEEFIDKTRQGIVELSNDLMSMNEPEVYGPTEGTLRKRNLTGMDADGIAKGPSSDAFLKKEIDAIKEANVIPAVLSNGHAK